MKKLAILLLFVAPVFGQTVTGSSLSFDTSSTNKCKDPAKGVTVLCSTPSVVTVSFDGAAPVTLPAKGLDGQAATLAIGAVASGAIGTAPKVTNSGTASAAVLNFTFPAPKDGTNGLNGKDGNPGATGSKGDPGPQGPAGSATLTNSDCSLLFTGQATADGSVAVRITCK